MTTFSPQTFLTNQGWEGPGSGLRKGSIKKPVTVAHKTNLKGIGKERDTGYAWWDDVFSMVANKKKGVDIATRKTSTGIHSPLPPGALSAVSSAPNSGTTTPVASTSTSHFHTDIIGQAKLEAARKEFYAKFLRGRPLEGTVQEAIESQEIEIDEKVTIKLGNTPQESQSAAKEEKRKEKELRRLEKEERRRLKKEKKDKKEKRKAGKNEIQVSDSDSEPVTGASTAGQSTPSLDTVESVESSKPEKKKRKHDEDDGNMDVVETAEAKAARKARKEEKKKKRKLDKV